MKHRADVKQRVLDVVLGGVSQAVAAERFRVSQSAVSRGVIEARVAGSTGSRPCVAVNPDGAGSYQ